MTAPDVEPTPPVAGHVPARGHPVRTAILTVLGWNLLVAIALGVWVYTVRATGSAEDWSDLLAYVLIVVGGVAIGLATAAGVVIAAIVVTRKLKLGEVRHAFAVGTASTLAGWAVPAIAVILYAAVGAAR
ncbi:hypothetical protein [Catellatospora tritici]|uniref:hypothetical protein n=1 Tax=Catellatospora tritici TaxID=2851566 RepID=UPI001C2DCDA9|nr:hypothetical protein [Catellatospora tritici]MBV1852815.1 hypothetical protein [Catellatospora tritici]